MSSLAHWPALVLTAGLATRLRPLSQVRAKAAMPVAGTTVIERIIRWLERAGVRQVVLNLHHRPESITAVVGDGSQFGVQVRYSWEPRLLGSAGGPRRALPLLEADRFFVINGDTLTDCSLPAVAAQHTAGGAAVTMAVTAGDTERYGGVLRDESGRVRGFGRPQSGLQAHHFIGVQAVDAAVFAPLQDNEPSETVRTLYPQLLAKDPASVQAFASGAEFLDIGTARDYLSTVRCVAAREGRAWDRGDDCTVAADAVVRESVLWDRVTVAAGAALHHCIVADDVHVAEGVKYADCVLTAEEDGVRATPIA